MVIRRSLPAALLAAAALAATASPSHAALSAGQLDPGFRNAEGKLKLSGSGVDRGPQTGRYYFGGTGDYKPVDGYADAGWERLLANGDRDHEGWNNTEAPEFCGKVISETTTDLSHCGINSLQFQQHTQTFDVVMQPSGLTDGRLVGAGVANFHGGYLYRMTEAGYKDTSFGDNGVAEAPDLGFFRQVAVQRDRKLVVATSTGDEAALARYTADGKLDTTYGAAGVASIYPEGWGSRESASALVALPDGGTLAAVHNPIGLVRTDPNGNRYPGWGTNGYLRLETLEPSHIYDYSKLSLIRLHSGGFLLSRGPHVVRITAAGAIDRQWGDNGRATVNVAPQGEGIEEIAEQPDGRILAVGSYGGPGYVASEHGAFILRLTQDGRMDTTFGSAGKRLRPGHDESGNHNSWNDLTLDPPSADSRSGKAVTAGHPKAAHRFILGPAAMKSGQLPSITGGSTAKDGATLTAAQGTWTRTDTTSSSAVQHGFEWLRCDAEGAGCRPILTSSGTPVSTSTYTATARDVGKRLRVRQTALVDNALNSATSARTAVVAPVLPSATAAPTVSAPVLRATKTVSLADRGTWAGTMPQSYKTQWMRCTTTYASSCEPIYRATGTSYYLTDREAGKRIRVRVTATNVGGSRSALSAVSGLVAAASKFVDRPVWDAFSGFRFEGVSPAPDVYGTPDVWSYAFGPEDTVADPGSYRPYGGWGTSFYSDAEQRWWNTNLSYGYSLPFVGSAPGAGSTGISIHPGNGNAGIVRWRNAGTNAHRVKIAGTIRDADASCGNGIRWTVLKGTRVLAAGDLANGGHRAFPATAGERSVMDSSLVTGGEDVRLAIGPLAGDQGCDWTSVDLRVTQRDPEVTVDEPAADAVVTTARPYLRGGASAVAGDATQPEVTVHRGTSTSGPIAGTLRPTRTSTGRWSILAPTLTEGAYTVVARQTNATSGLVGKSAPRTFRVDLP